ncbi:MAG TPA: cyclic nucleotide-binding domain-containing protein, partial [Cyclobacteriaceae bacterium]
EKVLFFQKIELLTEISGVTLSYLADISDEIKLDEGSTLVLDDKVNTDFLVLVKGVVDFYEKGMYISEVSRGQFIGEMLSKPNFVNTNLIIAKNETRILKFNKDKFYELLADNVVLAEKVLEYA